MSRTFHLTLRSPKDNRQVWVLRGPGVAEEDPDWPLTLTREEYKRLGWDSKHERGLVLVDNAEGTPAAEVRAVHRALYDLHQVSEIFEEGDRIIMPASKVRRWHTYEEDAPTFRVPRTVFYAQNFHILKEGGEKSNPGAKPPRTSAKPPRSARRHSTNIQTVLVSKTLSLAQAKAWLKRAGFRYGKVDAGSENANYWRFRQHAPEDYQEGSLRTITLGDDVRAVTGVPKRRSAASKVAGYGTRGPRSARRSAAQRNPAVRVSTTRPSAMTAAAINKELDKLEAQRSENTRAMIAAGRGHERYSDTAGKTDPLSVASHALQDRYAELCNEVEHRYGRRGVRLPLRGYGPRANPRVTQKALRAAHAAGAAAADARMRAEEAAEERALGASTFTWRGSTAHGEARGTRFLQCVDDARLKPYLRQKGDTVTLTMPPNADPNAKYAAHAAFGLMGEYFPDAWKMRNKFDAWVQATPEGWGD